jgi:hypothetical protein
LELRAGTEEWVGRREGRWAWEIVWRIVWARRRIGSRGGRSANRAGPFEAQGEQARPLRGMRWRAEWVAVELRVWGGSRRWWVRRDLAGVLRSAPFLPQGKQDDTLEAVLQAWKSWVGAESEAGMVLEVGARFELAGPRIVVGRVGWAKGSGSCNWR